MTRRLALGAAAIFGILLFADPAAGADCNQTSVGFIPIDDLGGGLYLGQFQGGLYPGGLNEPPVAHAEEGRGRALKIAPLNAAGNPDPAGRYVMVSIGMSNTTQEFCSANSETQPCTPWSFMGRAVQDFRVNHAQLAIVNGAQGGQPAAAWDSPTDATYDRVRNMRLAPLGLTEAQVQIVWVKQANPGPSASLPAANADAYALLTSLGAIARAVKTRYPNCRLLFLSNRIYAGYASTSLNPEPYAYETGFAVKWAVQAQITQMSGGGIDPRAGNLDYGSVAPWLAWGPNLWADGLTPRSDGLIYLCADMESDGTHPATGGESKVGLLLLNFMLRSPFSEPWFRACRIGDLDGDGALTAADATGLVNVLLNPGAATVAQKCAADCSDDGRLDGRDILAFVSRLLGG